MLSVVEKVIFLQGIDIFKDIPTRELAYLASIAQQVQVDARDVLYREGEISNGMYLVIEGDVLLTRDGTDVMTAGPRDAFGTWSLLDDEKRVVTATATQPTEVLWIDKAEFLDLLADHVQITQGIFKTITKRMRALMEIANRR